MKKLFCYLLIFATLLGMIPLTAHAEATSYGGEYVLSTKINHLERGEEEVVVEKHYKYLFMRFQYDAYFKIHIKNESGTQVYETKPVRVFVWNKKGATIDKVRKEDEKINQIYASLENASLTVEAEKLLLHALSGEERDVQKILFDGVIQEWYESESESVASGAVLSSISAGLGYKEVVQTIFDNLTTVNDELGQVIVDEDVPESEEDPTANDVAFAKRIMPWLQKIWDGINKILLILGIVNDDSVNKIYNAVNPPDQEPVYKEYQTQAEKNKLQFHNEVYEMINN